MTTASFSKAQPRLAKTIRKPGGIQVAQALAAAEATLEAMHEQLLVSIDQALAEIEGHLASWPASAEQIYQCAARIVEAAVRPEERVLEGPGRSLCDILDQLDPASPQTLEAVRVHVQTLKLLHRSPPDPAARESVLAGLRAVCAKLLIAPPAEIPEDVLEADEGAETARG